MNMELKLENAVCVGKKENLMQDGKTRYWNISIVKNNEACMLPCNEDVYNQAELYQPYDFTCLYRDGQYKGLRITHAGIRSGNGSNGKGGSDPQSTATGGKK